MNNPAHVVTIIGVTMVLGTLIAGYIGAWVLALIEGEPEGIMQMMLITIIIGAILFCIGQSS